MPKIKKIAIFSHSATDHVNWVLGLRSGFMKLGIEVITSWPQPEENVLNAIIESFKPDAIFEINRSKNQSSINKDIFYITLIQDNRAYGINILDGFGGSDLYYSIIPPKGYGFDQNIDDQAKPFFAGANTLPYYNPNIEKRFDLGLAGYISESFWLSKNFFKSHLLESIPKLGRYIDLYKELQLDYRTVTKSRYIGDVHEGIQQYFHKRNQTEFLKSNPDFQNELHRIFSMSVARTLNRHFTAQSMLKASSSVAFWGPKYWKTYPSFNKYYQGLLSGIESLSNGFQSLKINIHAITFFNPPCYSLSTFWNSIRHHITMMTII